MVVLIVLCFGVAYALCVFSYFSKVLVTEWMTFRHFSLLNVNFAGACGYDFVCDGRRHVRAYLRRRRGAI